MGSRGHVGRPEEWEPFPHFNRQGGLPFLLAKPQTLGAHFSVSQPTLNAWLSFLESPFS